MIPERSDAGTSIVPRLIGIVKYGAGGQGERSCNDVAIQYYQRMLRILLVLFASGTVNAQVVLTEAMSAPASAGDPLATSLMPVIDTNPGDYPGNIWITDTMQKVRQDAGAAGTVHWGTFYGTQNEFIDFQVHYHDSGSGTSGLSITAGDFVNLVTGTHIPASTNVAVYRQAYINVGPVPSNTGSSTFYKSVGRYPDVLIPAKDPYWGQTTNAWPFNVAAGQNQSAWIDVLVPANAPSGYYLGSVTVASGTSILTKMPVVIAVWQWPSSQGGQMPSTPTLTAYLGNWEYNGLCVVLYSADYVTPGCGTYPGADGSTDLGNTMIWLDASLLVKDHRFNMAGLQNVFPQTGPFTTWDSLVGPLMNGGCLTHNGAGNTCPVLAGSTQTVKSMDYFYGTASAAIWTNWQTYFNANGWGAKLVDALQDEPHTVAAFQSMVATARIRHSFTNPGVPEIVTADIWWGQFSQAAADAFSTSVCGNPSCIGNSIDVLTSTIYYFDYEGETPQTTAPYLKWLAGSTDGIERQWWMYQACTSAGTCTNGSPGPAPEGLGSGNVWNYPNYNVDGTPAANRAMEWMSFLHGNTGELYYAADVCNVASLHPGCVGEGQTWDPWNGIYYSGGWGDGTLVYAGSSNPAMPNYVGVATPIVLPSIRLKHIRDGVQDYEYLNTLKVAGKAAVAQQQVSSWITNSYTFETSGTGLRTARLNLGTAMHQLTYGPLVTGNMSQTITFAAPSNQTLSTGSFALSAMASSALTVTFASNSTTVCKVSGAEATLVTAGTCSITASQAGNSTYAPATPVTRTFLVSAGPPAIVSLAPNAGAGTTVLFKAVYSDPNGAADLSELLLQVNSSQSSANACYVYYQPQGNHLYLANNAGSTWMTPALTPGVTGTASNSQCTLNAASSSVTTAGNDLTLNIALTFSGAVVGSRNVYLYAAGLSGQNSGWIKEGTWVPASAGPPTIVSLSPDSGAGTSVTFKAVYSDPNGAGDLNEVLLQVNTYQSSANACYVYYDPRENLLYLANNSGNAWMTPGLTPGVAGTASNSQCTLSGAASSITTEGNDLTLTVALDFSDIFVGPKNMYLYAGGLSGQSSGWMKKGAWVP